MGPLPTAIPRSVAGLSAETGHQKGVGKDKFNAKAESRNIFNFQLSSLILCESLGSRLHISHFNAKAQGCSDAEKQKTEIGKAEMNEGLKDES